MTSPHAKPPSRIGWALLVIFCLLIVGLTAGTAVGSRFVPPGSGLAGPAIALGYGVIGALLAGVLGGLLSWKAPVSVLRGCGIGLGSLVLLLVAFGVWRFAAERSERRTELGLDVALPPGVDFEIRSTLAEDFPTRSYREMMVNGKDWSFEYIAVGPEAAECSGSLKAEEVEALIAALAAVRTRLATGEAVCGGAAEPVIMTVNYAGQGGDWSAGAGMSCTQSERELMALGTALRRIPLNALDDGRLSCDL